MGKPSKFDVFNVGFKLSTLGTIPDPRLMEDWSETPEKEKEEALKLFDRAPKGKIKYWEAHVSDVHDQNEPKDHQMNSSFFDTDQSDGGMELENLMAHVSVTLMSRYKQIAPIEHVEKRLIEWGNVVSPRQRLN